MRKKPKILSNSAYTSIQDLKRRMLKRAKYRAMSKGYKFDLTIDDIIIPRNCPIMKKPLIVSTRYSPSIDKIIPSLGYTKDNIKIISSLANSLKGDSSYEEMKVFSRNILKYMRNDI